jgi:hypothetical protein
MIINEGITLPSAIHFLNNLVLKVIVRVTMVEFDFNTILLGFALMLLQAHDEFVLENLVYTKIFELMARHLISIFEVRCALV